MMTEMNWQVNEEVSRAMIGEGDGNASGIWFQWRGDAYLNGRSVIFNEDGWGGEKEWQQIRSGYRDQIVTIVRLTGGKNFVGKRKKFKVRERSFFIKLLPRCEYSKWGIVWSSLLRYLLALQYYKTSSSVFAERLRDASCL